MPVAFFFPIPFHSVLFSLRPGCISLAGRWGVHEDHSSHHLRAVTIYLLSSIHSNVTEASLSSHFFPSPFANTLHCHRTNKNAQNLPVNFQSPLHTIRPHLRDAVKQPDIELQQDTWSVWLLPPCPPTTCTPSRHCHLPACPPSGVSMGCCLIWASFDTSVSSISQKELALASLFPCLYCWYFSRGGQVNTLDK